MAAGSVPYRDFGLEYPPGALPVFWLPTLGPAEHYRSIFEALMWICAAALLVIVVRSAAALGASPRRLLAIAVALGLFPARARLRRAHPLRPLAGGARRRRARRGPDGACSAGLAVLGIAVAAKIYLLVLLPPLLIYPPGGTGDGRPRSALAPSPRRWQWWSSRSCSSPPTACGTRSRGQLDRPLQIESLGASLLLAAHQLGFYEPTVVSTHGSQNLSGSVPDALATVQTVPPGGRRPPLWALRPRPCVGRAARGRLRRVGGCLRRLREGARPSSSSGSCPSCRWSPEGSASPRQGFLGAALISTHLWFPTRYWDMVDLQPVGWVVLVRNVLLVALAVVLAVATARARAPARSRSASVGPALDEQALDAHVAVGRVKPHRYAGAHPLDRELRADPDHRVVRTGHARVRDRGRAAGEDAGVVRLHMGVRPDHGGDAPVQHAPGRSSRSSPRRGSPRGRPESARAPPRRGHRRHGRGALASGGRAGPGGSGPPRSCRHALRRR